MNKPLIFIALGTALCAMPIAKSHAQGGQNAVKVNLLPLVGETFALEYERALTKRISVGAMFSTRAEKSLPMMGTIESYLKDDEPELLDVLKKSTLGATSFALEARFYTGKKGAFKGFYLAPYFKHTSYAVGAPITATVERTVGGSTYSEDIEITASGKLKASTVGLGFGLQFPIGRYLVIDWRIAGPGIGTGKGTLSGTTDRKLSAVEQAEFRKELDKLTKDDTPYVRIVSKEVNENGLEFKTDSPWANVRTGLSVGFRF